jgi:hypothetical protein
MSVWGGGIAKVKTAGASMYDPNIHTDRQHSKNTFCVKGVLKCVNPLKLQYLFIHHQKKTKQAPWPFVRKLTIPTVRPPLVGKFLLIEGCHVVSVADPHGR